MKGINPWHEDWCACRSCSLRIHSQFALCTIYSDHAVIMTMCT